jgi:hypothetical protein
MGVDVNRSPFSAVSQVDQVTMFVELRTLTVTDVSTGSNASHDTTPQSAVGNMPSKTWVHEPWLAVALKRDKPVASLYV